MKLNNFDLKILYLVRDRKLIFFCEFLWIFRMLFLTNMDYLVKRKVNHKWYFNQLSNEVINNYGAREIKTMVLIKREPQRFV